MYLLLLPLVLWLLYKWSVSNFDYFEKIGVPYEKPLPIVGNSLGLVLQKEGFVDMTRKSYDKFKSSKIFGFFNLKQVAFYLTDAELVKRITIKDFDHFMNHDAATTQADKYFHRCLVGLQDKEWKDMRITLSPIFTSSKMKMMFGLLSDQARDFVSFLEDRAKKGEVLVIDTKDIFARFTADGISTSALGFKGDCVRNKDSEIFKIAKKLLTDYFGPLGALKTVLSIALPKLYNSLELQLMSKTTYDFLYKVVIETMNERDAKNISRPDVIQLMLQLKKGQLQNDKENEVDDKELTNFSANVEYNVGSNAKTTTQFIDDDWISQGFIFFGAGFDTSSTMITMTCYELAKNPDIQRELLQEIDSVASTLNGKLISFETLHKMEFLDMVLSESLRKWPPATQGDRTCMKDYDLDLGNGKTVTIKKGQNVFLPIFHLHRDPAYFPNSEKFNPYRFSNENKGKIVQGSYLPFGMGPRTCIGSRFALMEGKLLLFNLLSKFSLKKCDKTPKTVSYNANFLSDIKEKIKLEFEYRK